MSHFLRNRLASIACLAALAFVAVAGVDAQSEEPIFEEDIVVSIQDGEITWVAPEQYRAELEMHLQQRGTMSAMLMVLDQLPPASPTNAVRFEGGWPAGAVRDHLDAKGYVVEQAVTPELPSATEAWLRTN